MRAPDTIDAGTVALNALAWTLADPDRAQRLLAVTGIEPEGLRERLGDPALLGATLDFLLANEADLVDCADALAVPPTALARAAEALAA